MPPWDKYKDDGTDQSSGPWDKYSTSQKNQDLSLIDVPGQAYAHLGSSAKQFGESLVQPIIHPVDTLQGFDRLLGGIASKLGVPGMKKEHEKYAEAAWAGLKERYGGWENIKRTMATDPVGFFADIATIPAGGEAALARLPGMAGKVGKISGTVARTVDPLSLAVKGATAGTKGVAELGGLVTGKGSEAIRGAARTGYEGGQNLQEYLKNLRDSQAHQEQFVQASKSALGEMWKERSEAYKRDIAPITSDPTILKFDDIDAAINKAHAVKQLQGRDISSILKTEQLPAEALKEKIENAIAEFRRPQNAQYHTVEGFDKLKQWLGDVKDHYRYGSPEWKIANDVYSAVRKTIVKQAPDYARVMKDYEEATDKLQEITKTLSLGKKASEDTGLRKLLSAGRSDVNANFGRRLSLLEDLNRVDPTILPRLYGQTLSPLTAGGLARLGPVGTGAAALYEHGANPAALAKIIPALIASSPRVWGELAAKAGQGARAVRDYTPQQIIDAARYYPDARAAILGSRAAGTPGRLRVDVGTGEVTNAPQ